MSLTKTEKQIANDLQRRCAENCVDAVKRTIDLCDSHAQSAYVACGGVIGASGVLMALLSKEEIVRDLPGPDMHDFMLFASMFAWATDVKDERGGTLLRVLPRIVTNWENLTGKKFNPDWLSAPLAAIVREAKAA